MADFVNAVIETDATQLTDTSIDAINVNLTAAGLPNWTPADADLAVITLGIIGQIAADIAGIASIVLPAIFRAFGSVLCGIPYSQGASATVESTWTFTAAAPTGGYTIPAGTAVLIDGQAFYAQVGVDVPAGALTATVMLVANQPGAIFNGLGGVDQQVQTNDQIDWVQSVFLAGITSGGADQETDDEYLNKLANLLTLQRISIVNAADYPVALMSDICEQVTGVAVGRATALDGFYPPPRVLSTGGGSVVSAPCSTTSSSPTVTITTPLVNQVPHVGATVTGTGIPAGATVLASPAPTPSGFTLSANATATGSPTLTFSQVDGYGPTPLQATVTFGASSTTVSIGSGPYVGTIPYPGAAVTGASIPAGTTVAASPPPTSTGFSLSAATTGAATESVTISEWQQVAKAVTAFVTDLNGNPLSTSSMDALAAWLATYREVNFLPFVMPPTYATVYVTASVHALPSFNAASVAANVQSALTSWLSPATWGNPGSGSTGNNVWLNSGSGFNIIRYLKAVGVAENVPGCDYVNALTLGFSPSPSGTADLKMTGPAPLPMSSGSTILVSTV